MFSLVSLKNKVPIMKFMVRLSVFVREFFFTIQAKKMFLPPNFMKNRFTQIFKHTSRLCFA